MSVRIAFTLGLLVLASVAVAGEPCKEEPCPADSATVVKAIHEVEPWVARQLHALHDARTPAQVQQLANALSLRTDSLASRFRQVFPEQDDGQIIAAAYNGLAVVLDACTPGAGAPYRGLAAAAQYSDPPPYRPAMYEALRSIADRAWSLARAKNPERVQRLLNKLDADHVDLIVAL